MKPTHIPGTNFWNTLFFSFLVEVTAGFHHFSYRLVVTDPCPSSVSPALPLITLQQLISVQRPFLDARASIPEATQQDPSEERQPKSKLILLSFFSHPKKYFPHAFRRCVLKCRCFCSYTGSHTSYPRFAQPS